MRTRIRPYKQGSASARALADYLGAKVLKLENSKFIPRRDDVVINWGNSSTYYGDCIVLNTPSAVANASNKLRTFQILMASNVKTPDWTISSKQALKHFERIFVRHIVTGHSGEGIEVIDNPTFDTELEGVPEAPLYVEGIVKKNEYRVIVVNGTSVDIKQKRLSSDAPEERSRYIRNLSNGWVYARENIDYVEGLRELAISAVEALGLDFGAVDIISDKQGNLYVLEVNTAFGLEGTTIELVGEGIKEML